MTARSKAPDNPAIDEMQPPSTLAEAMQRVTDASVPVYPAKPASDQPLPRVLEAKPKRPRDPELSAMHRLSAIVEELPAGCRFRVLNWLRDKYFQLEPEADADRG